MKVSHSVKILLKIVSSQILVNVNYFQIDGHWVGYGVSAQNYTD